MSWSLQLQSGDFSLSGAQFATVINEQKLLQDLRCALLEHMGTDDMHPGYGSLIDGGITPEGIQVPSIIGNDDIQTGASALYAEIQRIARDYQSQQLTRAKNDRLVYNRATLTPGEVLVAISDIQIIQNADALTVSVTVQTARGQDITIALPILTNS